MSIQELKKLASDWELVLEEKISVPESEIIDCYVLSTNESTGMHGKELGVFGSRGFVANHENYAEYLEHLCDAENLDDVYLVDAFDAFIMDTESEIISELKTKHAAARVVAQLQKRGNISTKHDIVMALADLWKELKDPEKAKMKCTEVLSKLRYVLDFYKLDYGLKSCDIEVDGKFIGSHDFVQLNNGVIIDFTLSQFMEVNPEWAESEWPYFGPPSIFHKNIKPLELMDDPEDKKKAQKVMAKGKSIELTVSPHLDIVYFWDGKKVRIDNAKLVDANKQVVSPEIDVVDDLVASDLKFIKDELTAECKGQEEHSSNIEVDDLCISVNVNFDHARGSSTYFDKSQEQWYPGDKEEITIEEVLTSKGQDILPYLSKNAVERLEEAVSEDTHSSEASAKDWLDKVLKLAEDEGYGTVDGILVDVQTANLIKTVYENFNKTNQDKLRKLGLSKAADVCWRLVNKQNSGVIKPKSSTAGKMKESMMMDVKLELEPAQWRGSGFNSLTMKLSEYLGDLTPETIEKDPEATDAVKKALHVLYSRASNCKVPKEIADEWVNKKFKDRKYKLVKDFGG